MMRYFAIIFGLTIIFSANAAVYRYVDKDGNVIFSDKPVDGATIVNVPPPSVTPSFKIPKSQANSFVDESPSSGTSDAQSPSKFAGYQSIRIVKPTNDEAFRSNSGDVEIVISIKPELNANLGHQFEVILDNRLIPGAWKQSSIIVPNVDRGTHTVQVRVTDSGGKSTFTATPAITFHLQRATAQ